MVTFCEKMCPNEQNQICRTGNGQILYRSTKFLQNEQVRGQTCSKQARTDIPYRKRRNPVRNGKNQACRTGNGQILYGMVRRIGKAMRQKHCVTAAGLTPKPAATAGSAAWSFPRLHLRFRCCQTFSLSTTKGYVLSKNMTE